MFNQFSPIILLTLANLGSANASQLTNVIEFLVARCLIVFAGVFFVTLTCATGRIICNCARVKKCWNNLPCDHQYNRGADRYICTMTCCGYSNDPRLTSSLCKSTRQPRNKQKFTCFSNITDDEIEFKLESDVKIQIEEADEKSALASTSILSTKSTTSMNSDEIDGVSCESRVPCNRLYQSLVGMCHSNSIERGEISIKDGASSIMIQDDIQNL